MIFPDIHRYVVEVHQLQTNAQFAELYTLAQVAPGPNAMYVTLIGWPNRLITQLKRLHLVLMSEKRLVEENQEWNRTFPQVCGL